MQQIINRASRMFILLPLLVVGFLMIANTVFAAWTLNNFSHTPDTYEAGALATYTYSFTNDTALVIDEGGGIFERIANVVFPSGYNVSTVDLSQATITVDSVPVALDLARSTVTVLSRRITITASQTVPANSAVVIAIPGITNPSTPGVYEFTISDFNTTNTAGNGYDNPDAIENITITAATPDGDVYEAEFWNAGIGESPAIDFDALGTPDYTESDFDISGVNWGVGSPDGSINGDNFVARFTRTDTFTGGPVKFTVTDADDGFRVYLDGDLVMERWNNSFGSAMIEVLNVTAGEHTIVVEYYEDQGNAYLFFNYEDLGLPGSGTTGSPWEISACYEIVYPGYYQLQNDITDVDGDCIIINADDVFFDGADFTISSDGLQENQAILSQGFDRISIENVTIDQFYDGIMIHDSQGVSTIDNVTITNSGDDAIDLHGVTNITISNSSITESNDDGIEIHPHDNGVDALLISSNVTINNLTITNTEDNAIEGLAIEGLEVTNSTINETANGDGINITSEDDPYQQGEVYSNTITISNNEFLNTSQDAISLRNVSEVTVQNNQITDAGSDGIYISRGTDVTVSGNTITRAGTDGIDFSYDDSDYPNEDVTITNNTMTSIGDNGIELAEVYGATISGNSMQVADKGIDVSNSEDIVATNNTITPVSEEYLAIASDEYDFTTLDIGDAADSITDTDDDSFTYTLPFTFNFMGRDITSIEVSTNGGIELLTDGEGCEICDEYGTYSDYLDNDIIFSSFEDLTTDGGYVAVFDLDDEGGERVIVEFYGRTLSDDDTTINPMHFQTVLYPNGRIEWHFKEMQFENYDSDMFTGVYDYESETLYQAGKAIDAEEAAYAGDFSGNGTFEEVEGFNANIGLDLDNVADSSFIGNSIRADQWVYAVDLDNVVFNDSNSGNTYYLLDGAGAWTLFDITDSTGNGYADSGTNRPFNEAILGTTYWAGEGQDLYPATENRTAVVPTRRRSSGGRASPAMLARLGIKIQSESEDNKSSSTPNTTNACPADQQLMQNLRSGARNGRFHPYTGGIVTQANILQAHLNRLGFNSGPADGILGPISDGAIKRMQTFLGTKADGFVGPLTRGLLNSSCGVNGLRG
jgi:parallel beta-helix repeat protein